MLSKIASTLADSSEPVGGGVIFIGLDREHQLRGEIGFKGIFDLLRQMRKSLVGAAGDRIEVVRFGLSSLLVMVPPDHTGDMENLAQLIFDSLKTTAFKIGTYRLASTISMSVSRFDQRFSDADELVLALVQRVEELIREGGNELAFVEPVVSSHQALSSNEHMLGLLMKSLGNDEMRVVFQPLLATDGEESRSAYQMLPRLLADDGELITAAEFIPLAREASLLPVIDRWMVARAIRLLKGPFRDQEICLFVNQSDILLSDSDRRTWYRDLLERTPELSHRIVLELSMEDAMMNLDSAAELIRIANDGQTGICLSRVDEHSRWDLFGAELKCQYLRMSPEFVTRLVQHRDLEQRFLKLSAPVREAGTRIIMPMIEDPETAASMWRSGADYMQGNMIQAPEDTIVLEG